VGESIKCGATKREDDPGHAAIAISLGHREHGANHREA
jgi:hypothetical protein